MGILMKKRFVIAPWHVALLFLWGNSAGAEELPPVDDATSEDVATSNFKLSGYGTLAFTADDDGDFAFIRELTQRPDGNGVTSMKTRPWLTDSRLGVQGIYQFNAASELVALLSLRDQESVTFDGALEWAYLGLHPIAEVDLRLGRVGFDGFLMSDHRQVGFAYPWVRPPVEFYSALPSYSVDGGDVAYRIQDDDGDGLWRLKMQVGASKQDFPFGAGVYSFEGDVWSLSLTRLTGPWRLRAGFAEIDIKTDPAPLVPLYAGLDALAAAGNAEAASLRRELTYKGATMQFSSLGAAYDDGVWVAQAELGYMDTSASVVSNGLTGYLSLGRRFGDWIPYAIFSAIEPLHAVRSAQTNWGAPVLNGVRDQAIGVLNATRLDQASLSLGARWDFNPQAALKLQWDHTRINPDGYGLWWTSTNKSQQTAVNLYTLSMEFLF
jgi:hypothetical protein